MVALRKPAQQARSLPAKREIRREQCRDDDGNSYTVIVWRRPGHISTTYTLEDGTPVHYEDECVFALLSGKMISRCQE